MHMALALLLRLLQDVDNMSASEARKRLEAFRKKQQAAAAAKQQQPQSAASTAGSQQQQLDAHAAAAAASVAAACVSFEGAISEAFEDSLKYYVAEEQKEVGLRLGCCWLRLGDELRSVHLHACVRTHA